MRGLKTYYIKASELRDRFQRAAERGNASRVVSALVKPSCLVIDEVGRCTFDGPCTDLFFDVVDRRYEKEGPNTMILTSNVAPSGWDVFFTGDDTLLCAIGADEVSLAPVKSTTARHPRPLTRASRPPAQPDGATGQLPRGEPRTRRSRPRA